MPETLEEILESVRPDSWGEKLEDIKDHIEKYDEARVAKVFDADEIIEYLNEILPTYWEVFHTHNTALREKGQLPKRHKDDNEQLPRYDIGIFLVGYSSRPIALSLAEIQPCEEIYFLYSSDTRPILSDISNRLSAMLSDSYPSFVARVADRALSCQHDGTLEIDDPSNPVSTFKRIKEIIDNIDEPENKRIALDLTGGKKTMLGGGYTAGAIWASRWSGSAEAQKLKPFCDMYYIDSKQYDPIQGSPVPGTEFLNRLENPYAVYNVESDQQARKLFEKHNYEAAVNLWKDVKNTLKEHNKRYGLETEFRQAVNQYRMAKCYYLWDSFDYDEAKKNKGNQKNDWGYFEKHVRNSIDVLDILSEVRNSATLFGTESRVIHYAMDHYQSGIRRKKSGKLDDAIVRFTQVIEMLCIYKVCQIAATGCLKEAATGMALHNTWCASESWRIRPLIRFLFAEPSSYDDRYQISDSSQFLQEIDYDQVNRIVRLIQPRNNFIHFIRRVNRTEIERQANNLQELSKKFLENLSCTYRATNTLSFNELLKLHELRQL